MNESIKKKFGARSEGLNPILAIVPLGTFWLPWTSWYLLDTLDLLVPFGYLGPLGTFWIPWTFRHLFDTLDL